MYIAFSKKGTLSLGELARNEPRGKFQPTHHCVVVHQTEQFRNVAAIPEKEARGIEISQGDKNNPEKVAVTLARSVVTLVPPPPPRRRTRSHHSLSLTRRAAHAGRPLRSLRAQGVAPRRQHEKTSILLFFPVVVAPPNSDDVHDDACKCTVKQVKKRKRRRCCPPPALRYSVGPFTGRRLAHSRGQSRAAPPHPDYPRARAARGPSNREDGSRLAACHRSPRDSRSDR